ncbi:MAG: hypothetical protein BWY35_02006 [Firmicutes bacterium ADurb.Bin248]|nr:MAG: hypothetical protein BWY35_02006 [Firmicutes bacterium ADurb.Bin248]HOG00165.1 hypothetical protein [Clostridia bacterium]HPK16867.1 hypothetical protein [Clostridia bacterium]
MGYGNLEELRATAIEKGIVNQEGNVSALAMNYFSGMHTAPLLDEIWVLSFPNTDTMDKLFDLIKQAVSAEEFEVFEGIMNALYVFSGIHVPDELHYIFECNDFEISAQWRAGRNAIYRGQCHPQRA